MKKLLATLLAFSMIACLALSVSAAPVVMGGEGVTTIPGAESQVIQIKLNDASTGATDPETVYMVEVEWSDTELVYNITGGEGTMTWNPTSHEYEVTGGAIEGSWEKDSFTVTVTNHSNTAITATLSGLIDDNGVDFTTKVNDVEQDSFDLASADEGASLGDPEQAPVNTFTVEATGDPTGSFNVTTTLTIADAENP